MSTRRIESLLLPDGGRTEETFARVLPELLALSEDELLKANVDVVTAITLVFGCLPSISTLEPDLVRKCADFDPRLLERMADYTWALRHAHLLYLGASRPAVCPPALLVEATQLRQVLRRETAALAQRGLVDVTRLKNLRRIKGLRALATDLTILSKVLGDSWPAIEGKSGITQSDIRLGLVLAEQILGVMGARGKPGEAVKEARELRRRAFTLFYRTYDTIRGAVNYVRWTRKDANRFAPSLQLGNKRKRASKKAQLPQQLHNSEQPMTDGANSKE